MTNKINDELKVMKQEIDALQIEIMKDRGPWYKSASVLISVFALLFSFGTTVFSIHKQALEDIRSGRAELRGILQRLTVLPKENFELIRKYKDDPEGLGLSGMLTQENSLLARQASEIVDRFPDEISASEYLSVAVALMAASDMLKVQRYLDRALKITADPNVKVAILRNYGALYLITGQLSNGRQKYEEALSIWGDFPNTTQYFKGASNALTEMYWSQAEMNVNNSAEARAHIQRALQHLNGLPPGPYTTQLQMQILQAQNYIEQGATNKILLQPPTP